MAGHRLIIDFDNTFGVPGCDVDDGLALLYLLGCEDVSIEAICTTYGNSELEVVHANTLRLLDAWGVDVPVLRGAAGPLGRGERGEGPSDAARFLVEALRREPGALDVLATGSTTNLGQACALAPDALDGARSITLMGGVTASLAINGRIMDELNLSCDPAATLAVLRARAPKAIASSQNCLPAFFTRDDLIGQLGAKSPVCQACDPWFDQMKTAFDWDGWVCWDVVAAAFVVRPDLFESDPRDITLYERFLSVGYLDQGNAGAPAASVNLPRILDAEAFRRHVLDAWRRACERLGL